MAHNLNYNSANQKHSFFSVKEKAWHSLGTVIEDYPTSAEALLYAGLDYTVEKRPLFTLDNQNSNDFKTSDNISLVDNVNAGILVPDYYSTLRTDTQEVLGVVGKDYHVVQNTEAFSLFDSIVGSGDGIRYETAGALGKGEKIFITAKLPEYIRIGRDDLLEQYIFLTTSHDGFGSITASFTPVRIVCQNTLNAALRNCTNTIKIRHTANAAEKLKQAHQLMSISNVFAKEIGEIFNYWAKVHITDNEIKKLVQMAMAPSKEVLQNLHDGKDDELSKHYNKIVDGVLEYSTTSPTQKEITTKNTLFGTYNAVTGYYQNVRNFKNDESKFKSIMYGTGLQRAQTAFNLCDEFARKGSLVLS
ncbi:alpha/beta hydrolase [Pedobacter yonginense]|uniref:Alpha/beta hydrolase n=1 Tax=Pedobacter yonginense TaxID=651869 RepID=A0A317EK14_9SPHI|nr:DUF932 domain-containing protein [Pedobacter yonginense]PWS26203.1 alpha/beta hydrolase [Pedobacter yonginense]